MTYKIKGTVPIYISEWEFKGITFKVHRPVDERGIISREGWQFSLDGIPINLSHEETKGKAKTMFKRTVKMAGWKRDDLHEHVQMTKEKNRAAFS